MSEPTVDDLLAQLRQALANGATDEEVADLRKRISRAPDPVTTASEAARAAQDLEHRAPGARLATIAPHIPTFTPTPEIQSLLADLRTALAQSPFADRANLLLSLAEPYLSFQIPKQRDATPEEVAEIEKNGTSYAATYKGWNAFRAKRLREMENVLPLGASRFGFLPDLPPSLPWPTLKDRKLFFLAQIDFASLPHWPGSPLPTEGWLYLFAQVFDHWTHTFLYHTGPREELVRHEEPTTEDEIWPDNDRLTHDLLPLIPRLGLHIDTQQLEPHFDAGQIHEIQKHLRAVAPYNIDSYANTGFAGHLLGPLGDSEHTPTSAVNAYFHGNPTLRQLAQQPAGLGNDWIHLLSLQSAGSMQWCDCGFLYFLIRRSDLLTQNFNNVVLSLCTS